MPPPTLLQPWLRLPAFAVNGVMVALGVGSVQFAANALAGPHVAALMVSGAVCASIADLPNTPRRTLYRVGAAALLSSVAALVAELLGDRPFGLGLAVGAIAFTAMMTLAWGARAGAVSFAPVLAMIFTMAVPSGPHPVWTAAGMAAGAAAYVAWALIASVVCQRRYRTLALAQALRATAALFRARAEVLLAAGAPGAGAAAPLRAWVGGEALLADRLQAARDFLFAAEPSPGSDRDIAILLRAIDLRDVLLASRLDADLLGDDPAGRAIREALGAALHGVAERLDAAAEQVRDGSTRHAATAADPATFAHALRRVPVLDGDPRPRLFPSLLGRVDQLGADVRRVERLLQGDAEPLPLTRAQLDAFVAPEGWPPGALRPHLSADSPVLRHALRMGVALATAYYLALLLPWATHPYWLVLSVAVVLRGKLGETLARRNARVLGTLLGCLVVVGLSHVASRAALDGIFLVAIGIAHAFALQLYWLTSTAASVMALLQAHSVDPGAGFAIAERVADTFLGVALAWCFSYMLPSWERRSVRSAIGRLLRDLLEYASRSLTPVEADSVDERLARRRAYDSLAALAAALQRSSVEPQRVRLPAAQIAALLDHGERLMAHLSMVRLTLARLKDEPARVDSFEPVLRDAVAALAAHLGAGAETATAGIAPVEPLEGIDLDILPTVPASDDPMPWLNRRLALLVHEARLIRSAAGAALAKQEA